MSHATAVAATPPRNGAKWLSRALLAGAAILAPASIAAALATNAWWLLFLSCGAVILGAWSMFDARAALVIAVLIATFMDYTTGRLTMEMTVLSAWLAWVSLLLFWRGAWKGFVQPPAELTQALLVWLGACAMGLFIGLLQGNNMRSLGVELAGALWPALGIGIIQVYSRKSAIYAGFGLIAIGLIHTAFGLTMLQIYHQRLGGIYFTTVTGMIAVGLWTVALLAPSRKVRGFCLLAMIPMLAHLLFSFTRGYWLGFIVGMILATILSWRNLGRFEPNARFSRIKLVAALLAVLAVTSALSTIYFGEGDLFSSISKRFNASFSTELSGETMSNVLRLVEYEHAVDAAMQSPWIGKGLGYAIINKDPLLGTTREQWFVHNYYLLIWLKLGIVGLAAFGFLLWKLIRAAVRTAKEDADWLVRAWAITAMAVTGQVLAILLTNYSLADVTTAFPFAFIWGIFWALRADARNAA
jgi:O-antigen ligase